MTENVMSKRGMKIAALVLSGGILLQAGGCSSLLVQQLTSTIINGVISALLSSVLNAAAGTV
jgi:hypothetical protein